MMTQLSPCPHGKMPFVCRICHPELNQPAPCTCLFGKDDRGKPTVETCPSCAVQLKR